MKRLLLTSLISFTCASQIQAQDLIPASQLLSMPSRSTLLTGALSVTPPLVGLAAGYLTTAVSAVALAAKVQLRLEDEDRDPMLCKNYILYGHRVQTIPANHSGLPQDEQAVRECSYFDSAGINGQKGIYLFTGLSVLYRLCKFYATGGTNTTELKIAAGLSISALATQQLFNHFFPAINLPHTQWPQA